MGTSGPQIPEKDYNDEYDNLVKKNKEMREQLSDDARIKRQGDILRAARMRDISEGTAEGAKIFTPGSLGRIDDQAGDMKTIFDQRRAAVQGFTPQEQQAMREDNMREVQRNNAAASRDLQRSQARNRVYGATASAQQGALQTQLQGQLADQERKLFLDNINAKRQGVDALEQSALNKEKFNIDQTNKELQGKLSTGLTYAGLGTAERASVMNQILGEKNLQANLSQGGGKK